MIETISKTDERTRDFTGKYVFGGLPVGRNVFYPAAPLLVETSSGQVHSCRKLVVTRDSYGNAQDISIFHGENGELYRARHETIRFVCDTEEEALALLSAQGPIREAVSKRTFENEHEVDAEIRAIIADAQMRASHSLSRGM